MTLLSPSLRRAGASAGVIGAGIFGISIALELSRLGIGVTLYESRPDILQGATARNFFRLHRGYHYPRDADTARQARDGYESFARVFADALAPPVTHHYAVAASGSLTGVDEFRRHCDELGIRARPVRPRFLVPQSVHACFEVDESYYDVQRLRRIAWERLNASGVRVRLGSADGGRTVAGAHDVVVVAAYGAVNGVLGDLGHPPIELQYEVCEVPVVRAPRLARCSLVVMDGPFVSVGPYGDREHVLYDVVHSVHRREVGRVAPARADFARELDGAPGSRPATTRFPAILDSTRRFLALQEVTHVGSLFSERVVLPGVHATDARPTLVQWVAPDVMSVLSGKVTTCVDAAHAVAETVGTRLQVEQR